MSRESRSAPPQLIRAIGRWSMVALAVNCILGSGIFGLPSLVAGLLGRASPLAMLLAGAGMGLIIGCYAEVGSQFTETGGTYLYLRHAFGRLVGLQVGWMSLLARLTASAPRVHPLGAVPRRVWAGGAGAAAKTRGHHAVHRRPGERELPRCRRRHPDEHPLGRGEAAGARPFVRRRPRLARPSSHGGRASGERG